MVKIERKVAKVMPYEAENSSDDGDSGNPLQIVMLEENRDQAMETSGLEIDPLESQQEDLDSNPQQAAGKFVKLKITCTLV